VLESRRPRARPAHSQRPPRGLPTPPRLSTLLPVSCLVLLSACGGFGLASREPRREREALLTPRRRPRAPSQQQGHGWPPSARHTPTGYQQPRPHCASVLPKHERAPASVPAQSRLFHDLPLGQLTPASRAKGGKHGPSEATAQQAVPAAHEKNVPEAGAVQYSTASYSAEHATGGVARSPREPSHKDPGLAEQLATTAHQNTKKSGLIHRRSAFSAPAA